MGLGMGFAMANRMMQPGGAGAPGPMSPPPPPPAAWHIAANGQSQGPFALEVISDGIAKGQITANTQVWSAGMSGWLPAGQVPQLAALFQAATPPPPPPAS
jgi:hypothetical protein